MIKIGTLKNKQKIISQKIINAKLTRIRQELSQHNFCFSDENCYFEVNPNICAKELFIALQIRVSPNIGLYAGIDFLVSVFIEDNVIKPPKIYNDRRIFHPNIDPYTLEIAVPEVLNWNPTNTLTYLLRRLKYTLIQPNNTAIPNNPICKKAACLYKLDRENFRNHIVQHCPIVLTSIVERSQHNATKILSSQMRQEQKPPLQRYLSMSQIVPASRIQKLDIQNVDQLQFLSKRLNNLHINTDSRDPWKTYESENVHINGEQQRKKWEMDVE